MLSITAACPHPLCVESLLSPCVDSEIGKYLAVPFSSSYNMELLFDYLLIIFSICAFRFDFGFGVLGTL